MKAGILLIPSASVRKEPEDKGEMINQLLFGESFQVLESTKKWSFIEPDHDHYTGWIDNKQFQPLTEEAWLLSKKEQKHIVNEIILPVQLPDKTIMHLVKGSIIPSYNASENSFKITGTTFKLYDELPPVQTSLKEIALPYLNAPYLWGGRSPFGIDCSGLTQMIFRQLGIQIPRDSKDQVQLGRTIHFTEETESGDLAFFGNEEGEITHVGVLLNPSQIMHASGKVRIDHFDQQGIYNKQQKYYTHTLRIIKRIL